MDEDKLLCLKRFGFLPTQPILKQKNIRHVGRRPSDRHYVQDQPGVYLTTRESEVSWLMAKGSSVRETAEQMNLSPRTVEFYLGNVRRKLRVRSKDELLRILYRNDFFRQVTPNKR